MGNNLSLRILGGPDKGIVDAFQYYEGEDRVLALQLYDEETENSVPIYTDRLTTGGITVFANAGGGQTVVTSVNHNLTAGRTIKITGTTSYDGTYVILSATADTFNITKTFVANDATGTWTAGPTGMQVTFPGSVDDVIIPLTVNDIDSTDHSIFSVTLSAANTTAMITGFIKFEFTDSLGKKRIASIGHAQEKLS